MRLARRCILLAAALACLVVPASAAAAQPTLSLAATDAELGSPVIATATLAEGSEPTGTISFSAHAPDDPTCAEPPVFTASTPVNGNGDYPSDEFTPTALGTYHWSAEYSGDLENDSASSSCSAESVISQATPGLSTTATSATVGASISDTATLSGGFSPTGTITFKAFGPDDATCSDTAVFEASVPVNDNGSYGSGDFTPGTAGAYRWTADYSGDLDNAAASSSCNAPNETSTIAPATPGLSTTATSATIGSAISDTATLSGGFSPSGQILFKAFGPGDTTCSGAAVFEASVPVSAAAASTNFTPGAAGAYRWTASYAGDANNDPASSGCNAANETSTVAKASPGLTTTATNATVGAVVSDSGTLSGGFSPTGTITFKAFGPGDTTCTGAPVFTASPAVNDNGSYGSGDFTTSAAGQYRWTATYSGDANNNAATSACNAPNETSTVAKATPGLTTSATSAPLGFPISDTATLSGGFSPTGTITFKAFGPNNATCAGAAPFEDKVSVNGNGNYKPKDFNGALLGSYRWTVSYSGDANNEAAASGCNAPNETSTVGKLSPGLTSSANSAAIQSPISDTATLTGGFSPTGTITFKAFGPGDPNCLGTALFTANAPVSGNGIYSSGPFTPAQLGNYKWIVSYGGDVNNNPVAPSACGAANQTSVVSKATPLLSPSAGNATIGSSIANLATFSGGVSRTGQVVFRAFDPADATCSGTPVFAATVDVTPGNGTYGSGAFTPGRVGAYRWTASYSGDSNNAPTTTACNAPNSVSIVAQATPAIATKVSAPSLPIGTAVHDTATLAGGFQPGGSITFRLYGPGDANCRSQPVFANTIPVSGNAAYTSGGYAPGQPGQYFFTASYSGDAANRATTSPCNAAGAAVAVSKRTPKLSGRVSLHGTNRIATRANLAAAAAPKGKILFRLYGPNNSRCAGKPVFSQRVTVHGGGKYQSSVFRARARGVYRLTVAYAGDAWNKPARSGCNKAGQSVRVG